MGDTNNNPLQTPAEKEKQEHLDKLDASQIQQLDDLKKVFEPHLKSPSMNGEVGQGDVGHIYEKEAEKIKKDFGEVRDKLAQNVEVTSASQEKRAEVVAKVINDLETAEKFRIKNIQLILNAIVKGDHITTEEAEQLKRRLAGVEKIAINDVETQNILAKLQIVNHQDLDARDYDHIIKMMSDPKDMNFEASTAGMLIGLMRPKERSRLIQEMMKTDKKKEVPKVIDAFLSLGLLSIRKGEDLFEEAKQHKCLTEEEFNNEYRRKFDDGVYLEQMAKVRETIKTELSRMGGKYGNSLVERSFGMLPGLLGMVHSVLWIATNTLASGGDFAEMFKTNPYILAAIAEFGLSVDSFTGAMSIGGGVGNGVISRTVQRFMAKEGPQTTEKKEAYENLTTIYCNYSQLGKFFENGGVGTLLEAKNAQLAKGVKEENLRLTVDDLKAVEKDETQKAKLDYSNQHFPQSTQAQIADMLKITKTLDIQKQQDFNAKLAVIHEDQDITPSPSTTTA